MATVSNAELVKAAEQILAAAKNFNGDQNDHITLLRKSEKLVHLIETPADTMWRQYGNNCLTAALDVLISSGALHKIPREGTVTAKELGKAVQLDESVITRMMRILCVQGIAEEPESETYRHNAKSLAYITDPSQSFFSMNLDFDGAFRRLPAYFESHTVEDIIDLNKSPYAFYCGKEGATYYEVLMSEPAKANILSKTMVQMETTLPILGAFPFRSMKAEVEAEPQRPFIVDVGGGVGRILNAIQEEAPAGFGGEMILQDTPGVLESIPREDIPRITKMAHDFFTPQPVQNAHLYLLRRVLHDFYEPVCIEIVKNIAIAMGPTSRLLIGDIVLPEKTGLEDDPLIYWLDLAMLLITGKEKTAKQFSEILDAAGLQLVRVWRYPIGAQAIVEAKLKK